MRAGGWLALVAIGCGGDGGGGGGGFDRACDQSEVDGDCVMFTGTGWEETHVTDACADAGEVLDECPAEGAVGSCTLAAGTISETVSTFYTGFYTPSEAELACTGSGGAWGG